MFSLCSFYFSKKSSRLTREANLFLPFGECVKFALIFFLFFAADPKSAYLNERLIEASGFFEAFRRKIRMLTAVGWANGL